VTVMKSKQLGLAGALLISTLSSSAWADLVTNGNFSGGNTSVCGAGGPGGTCPGWTVTEAAVQSSFLFNAGNTSYDGSSVVIPPGAGFASFGASAGVDDELSQVLATVPGQSYKVSFLLAGLDASASEYPGIADQDFSVQWNGTTIFSETNNLNDTLVPISIDPVATGSSTTLAFFGRNLPATNVLAEVSVVPGTTTKKKHPHMSGPAQSIIAAPASDPPGVPGPIAGAGLPGLVAACGGLLALWRRKRKAAATATD